MAMPKRNIGVTGFMSARELEVVQDCFQGFFEKGGFYFEKERGAEPRLMAGILASHKTVHGQPNRHPGSCPRPEDLRGLVAAANRYPTLNLVHYYADDEADLLPDCELIAELAGPGLHGLQLNLCWPDPDLIRELRRRYPYAHILLQIGERALNRFARGSEGTFAGYDLIGFMARMGLYEGAINEVLLDPSGGRGLPFQPERLAPLIRVLMRVDGLGIGVAGGLCAETLPSVAELAAICPYLGIDAQNKLHNPEDGSLNLDKTLAYVQASFNLFYRL